MKTISLDPSKNNSDLTRVDEGYLPAEKLMCLKGACGEHLLFSKSQYGRKSKEDFESLADDIAINGMDYPVTVHIEADGSVVIWEGNHRLRAAASKGLPIYVEIKYFGESYKNSFC